jgi:hypothetical protein
LICARDVCGWWPHVLMMSCAFHGDKRVLHLSFLSFWVGGGWPARLGAAWHSSWYNGDNMVSDVFQKVKHTVSSSLIVKDSSQGALITCPFFLYE